MLNYDNFAITLGRAVDVFVTAPDSVVQQKGALRALVALSTLGAAALRVEDGVLFAGGKRVPATLPFVEALVGRMESHRVHRLNISRAAAANDLLTVVKTLASEPTAETSEGLRKFDTLSVGQLQVAPELLGRNGRPVSVSRAFDRAALLREIGDSASGPPVEDGQDAGVETPDPERQPVAPTEIETAAVSETAAEAGEQDKEEESGDRVGLDVALLKLAQGAGGPETEALVLAVVKCVEADLDRGADAVALEGIASLVNHETRLPPAEANPFTEAVERLLVPETLVRLARLATDSRHFRFAVTVLHRAGAAGAGALFEQLVKAPTVEQKDAYGAALVAVPDGVAAIEAALGHEDPTVVLVAVDQLAKLNTPEIAPAIGRLAESHSSREVRSGACRALLDLAKTESVLAEIERILGGRAARFMAEQIGGKVPDSLVEALIKITDATEDAVARKSTCQALGRVGTPRATEQLIKLSLAGGRFFGRKPVDVRLAAMAGLGLIDGPAAQGTLEELVNDRNPEIKTAALTHLEERNARNVSSE